MVLLWFNFKLVIEIICYCVVWGFIEVIWECRSIFYFLLSGRVFRGIEGCDKVLDLVEFECENNKGIVVG